MSDPIFKFQSSKEHYTADACVVWCFDDRFYKLLKAFGKEEGWGNIDLVKLAGGAKALAAGPSPERDVVLGQIKASIRLHNTNKVILMNHCDCGAYGGSKHFAGREAEHEYQNDQLMTAKHFLEQELPQGFTILCYLADFDGLHPVEADALTVGA